MNKQKSSIIAIFLFLSPLEIVNADEGKIILNQPQFPFIFELNTGESLTIDRTYKKTTLQRTIKLISFTPLYEPNYWFKDTHPVNFYKFIVKIEVDGKTINLFYRPYQMPVNFEGLRIYVENIKLMDESAAYNRKDDMEKHVRLSVCLKDEPWGPENIVFPINDYLWRSSVYNNTWGSLVPFNQVYYHRGEDYGAIPDKLDVVAPIDGIIMETPLPDGDGKSNAIYIENEYGFRWCMSHMNIEHIDNRYQVGARVRAGTIVAKTGMTWDGAKKQHSDPHFHTDISIKKINLASFPYLMEAYLRKYKDPIVAIAGGYRFAIPGQKVVLDASRSIVKNGNIFNVNWKLSNGKLADQEQVEIVYDKPGLYAEELIVENDKGEKDRDFLYVKVFDYDHKYDFTYGWAYYYPTRNIKTGDTVLFWNRMINADSDVKINFGDSSNWVTVKKEITHAYKSKGRYVVTLLSVNEKKEPTTLKMEVIVE